MPCGCLVVSPVFGQLSFPSELAVLRFSVFSLVQGIDRRFSSTRSIAMENFMPLDHNII